MVIQLTIYSRYTNYLSCNSYIAVQLALNSNTFVEDTIISSQLIYQSQCTFIWTSTFPQLLLTSMTATIDHVRHILRYQAVNMSRSLQSLQDLLRSLSLDNVEETGTIIGRGAYGVVCEVKVSGLVCAGKTLHEAIVQV